MDLGANARKLMLGGLAVSSLLIGSGAIPTAAQTNRQPNIVVIMADDIGWSNIGAYSMGMMAGKTPNLDNLAKA
jgi:arylsulfatase